MVSLDVAWLHWWLGGWSSSYGVPVFLWWTLHFWYKYNKYKFYFKRIIIIMTIICTRVLSICRGTSFFHSRQLILQIGHFWVPPGLCIRRRLSAQPLIWKWLFILVQIKLIFARKVVHLASFWKWGFLELGRVLLTSEGNSTCMW